MVGIFDDVPPWEVNLLDKPKRTLLSRPWSDADIALLKRLHAEGATLLRAAAALNRRAQYVRKRAREFDLHFAGARETKRRVRELHALDA